MTSRVGAFRQQSAGAFDGGSDSEKCPEFSRCAGAFDNHNDQVGELREILFHLQGIAFSKAYNLLQTFSA